MRRGRALRDAAPLPPCENARSVEDSPAGFVAYLALAAILPAAFLAFRGRTVAEGAILTILGALLFGPVRATVKLPLLPPLGKEAFAYLSVLVLFAIRAPGRLRATRAGMGKTDLLPILAALGGIGTALTNTDARSFGTWHVTHVPAMTLKDGLFITASSLTSCLLPFFVGRALVRDHRDLRALLRGFAIAGLVYAPLAFLEMRLSPQLHNWLYGYHPHEDFLQSVRMGGYRPTIFMAHGLAVSLFFLVSAIAMSTLPKRERIGKLTARQWTAFLVVVVLACKSTGTILYAALFLPLAWFASPRVRVRVSAVLAVFVLVYPALRAEDLFPVQRMLEYARTFGEERANSLFVRFFNEGVVLEHARERILFGWGTFGRHLVYDAQSGQSSIRTDGAWIILVGMQGLWGMVTTIGTLLFAIARSVKRIGTVPAFLREEISCLTLLVALTSLDLVPNGLFANYPFLLAGALTSALTVVVTTERARALAARRAAEEASFVFDEPAAPTA